MKGPRAFDASGLPLHADNQTIAKERYTFDRDDPDLISNEVTVIDHALTHPWTATRLNSSLTSMRNQFGW
jgi:hypothetical protein